MLMSIVFSEMGNLFLIIGICSKKLNSATGKFYFHSNNPIFLKEMNSTNKCSGCQYLFFLILLIKIYFTE